MLKQNRVMNTLQSVFLESPSFPDNELKTRQAYLLNFVLLNYWFIIVITSILLIFSDHKIGGDYLLIVIAVILVFIEIMKYQEQIFLASIVLLSSLWFLVTILCISTAKTISIFTLWYVPIIIIAGLLLGSYYAYITTLSTFIVTTGLLYVNELNLISGPYFVTIPITDWVLFFIALVQTIVPVNLMIQGLNENASELESKVEKRTNELAMAKKKLELYMYSLSHDLKNPLDNIYSLIEILGKDHEQELSESGKEILEKIRLNSYRMINLSNELLQFFTLKDEAIERRPILMNEIITNAINNFKIEEIQKIKFEIDELPDNVGEPLLITQVWVNLISNEIKYSRYNNDPKIKIGFNERKSYYFITDNGIGFDMQKSKLTFRPFQRLHKGEQFEGTGIGLAFVNSIIQKHNGKLWYDSKEGEGTTFNFSLNEENE